MTAPYRGSEDRLDRAAREEAAVVAFGAWRERTRAIVLLVFCVVGAFAGIAGYLAVRWLQFLLMDAAVYYVNAAGFFGVFIGFALVGRQVSTVILRRRTPAAIEQLGARYQIDTTVLAETARAVAAL